jgi:hypothetical protein
VTDVSKGFASVFPGECRDSNFKCISSLFIITSPSHSILHNPCSQNSVDEQSKNQSLGSEVTGKVPSPGFESRTDNQERSLAASPILYFDSLKHEVFRSNIYKFSFYPKENTTRLHYKDQLENAV